VVDIKYRFGIMRYVELIVEVRHLRYFVAVAHEQSFTRAARRLGIAQPALSQQIQALENELGVILVERSNRTSGLTEAGARLLTRAERILLEMQDAAHEMAAHAGLQTGTVRIGCALQTLLEGRLPALLATFHAANPGIRIIFREVHTRQVLELLQRGEVDLGLVHLGKVDRTVVGAGAASPLLALASLGSEPLVLIVAPGHRLAARSAVDFEVLREETFIAFRPGATVRKMMALAAKRCSFAPRIGFTTANIGTVRAFVSAGLGVALVPRSALDAPSPPLRAIPIASPRLERIVTLARNTERYETAAVAAVRKLLVTDLRALSSSVSK
jgi:LysR family transcriptional regulator, transcription activator of glutamate synthase operon